MNRVPKRYYYDLDPARGIRPHRRPWFLKRYLPRWDWRSL